VGLKPPGRVVATVIIAVACTLMGILGLFDRLNYVASTKFDLLAATANNEIWTLGFIAVSVFVWCSVILHQWQQKAMQAAVVILAPWSLYNLLWGLTTDHPVSLAAPILAAVLAVIAHSLAVAWAPEDTHYDTGR